jgi:hypothetical protein
MSARTIPDRRDTSNPPGTPVLVTTLQAALADVHTVRERLRQAVERRTVSVRDLSRCEGLLVAVAHALETAGRCQP